MTSNTAPKVSWIPKEAFDRNGYKSLKMNAPVARHHQSIPIHLQQEPKKEEDWDDMNNYEQFEEFETALKMSPPWSPSSNASSIPSTPEPQQKEHREKKMSLKSVKSKKMHAPLVPYTHISLGRLQMGLIEEDERVERIASTKPVKETSASWDFSTLLSSKSTGKKRPEKEDSAKREMSVKYKNISSVTSNSELKQWTCRVELTAEFSHNEVAKIPSSPSSLCLLTPLSSPVDCKKPQDVPMRHEENHMKSHKNNSKHENHPVFRSISEPSGIKYGVKTTAVQSPLIKTANFNDGFLVPKMPRPALMKAKSMEESRGLSDAEFQRKLKRGELRQYQIEAHLNRKKQKADDEWMKQVEKKFRQKRVRKPSITKEQKKYIENMKRCEFWPQGTFDYERIAKARNLFDEQVSRQFQRDPRDKIRKNRNLKRQIREKISPEEQEMISERIARDKPDLSTTVSREAYRSVNFPNIRVAQFEFFCRSRR